MASRREIKLLSPVGADPAVFHWPLTSFDGRDGFEELRLTFNFVCDDIPELRLPCQNILNKVDPTSFDSVKESCERFNRAVSELQRMWKGTSCSKNFLERNRPSNGLLKHILSQCYYRAVTDPEKLNQYPPFSPEVYGETSFELIERMVSKIQWPENGVFIDLGSGVGQVVLQVAAMVPGLKMAYGVERADLPSSYAIAMDTQFRFWMAWYGKSYSDYQLLKDDFLMKRWADSITDADVVFANNFAFGPQVNHELKQRLQHMKQGAKIVCSLSLCPMKFEITERNLSDIGAMLRVEELSITPNTQAVSWTGRDFSFYLHTVDRTLLEKYFERKNRHRNGGSLSHSSASSVNSEDSMASAKSQPTTKHHRAGDSLREASSHANSPLAISVPNGQQNGGVKGSDSGPEHHVPEKKKKVKDEETAGSQVPVQQQKEASQPVHRGRGRPAKVQRVAPAASTQTLRKSTALKSTLRGAEEIMVEKVKRKREKEHHRHDKAEPPVEPSAKKAMKMPPGLDWLHQASVHSTTQPDLTTREGRVDAFLIKLRVKMISFLEQATSAENKTALEARLEAARKKNAELVERKEKIAGELDELTNENQAKLKAQVDSLASLSTRPASASASEFVADARRIVDRNKSLHNIVNNTPTTSAPKTSVPLGPFQTIAPTTMPRPSVLTEQQQQAVFNHALAALLPLYGQNPGMFMTQQFMSSPPELMRHMPGPMMMQTGPAPPGVVPGAAPWYAQLPMVPQMGMAPVATPQPATTAPPTPAPPPVTTSSASQMTIPPSVEEALKAIMATAVSVTDKTGKKNRHQAGTPQLHHGESSNHGSTTPDVAKRTPQRRTPNKARNKQNTPTDPSPSRGGDGVSASPTTHTMPLTSADMADFLSHLRLPEPNHPKPVATQPAGPATTMAPSTKPSGPVLHISNMIFRPASVTSPQQPGTTPSSDAPPIVEQASTESCEAPPAKEVTSPPSETPSPPTSAAPEPQPSVA